MAWTQADLDAIDEAIATGAMKIKYSDKEVTYRSLADMRSVRKQIADTLSGNKSRRRVAVFSNGLG